MTNGIILQARMGSTRLPGKVLTILNQSTQETTLKLIIDRLVRTKNVDVIILATSDQSIDDPIQQFYDDVDNKDRIKLFRGSEDDVLDRFYQASIQYSLDHIIRITADCPLVDPSLISLMFSSYRCQGCDYMSNTIERTYPRGLDVEIFSFETLKKTHQLANQPFEREHVTPYIYGHPFDFKVVCFGTPENHSKYRITLDTPKDLVQIRKIFDVLGNEPNYKKLIEYLENSEDPDLLDTVVKFDSESHYSANRHK